MHHLVIQLVQPASEHIWPIVPSAVGAILGAGAAAIPAYFLARKTAADAKRAAEDERKRIRRGFARTAGFKLQSLVNALYSVEQQLENMLDEAERMGLPPEERWKLFKPFMGTMPERVSFLADELSLAYDAGEAILANRMILIAERHFSDELGLKDYSDRRRKLADLVADGAIRGLGEEHVIQRSGAVIAELAAAANELRRRYGEDFAEARVVLSDFATAMQRHFRDPGFLRIGWADQRNPAD